MYTVCVHVHACIYTCTLYGECNYMHAKCMWHDVYKLILTSCSKKDPETSSPVPMAVSPIVVAPSSELTAELTSELFPLHSGEQLPLGLLGDETPGLLGDETPSMSPAIYP